MLVSKLYLYFSNSHFTVHEQINIFSRLFENSVEDYSWFRVANLSFGSEIMQPGSGIRRLSVSEDIGG